VTLFLFIKEKVELANRNYLLIINRAIHTYTTIAGPSFAEYKDRGSRFIGYVIPLDKVEEFRGKLSAVKKEHPKASHYCFAYRIGNDRNLFRVSDDGEPSGSAGRPILGQIDSKGLTNVLVIVVRYFGGTLLGVRGLINAYKSAALLAIEAGETIVVPVRITCLISFNYTQLNDVLHQVRIFDCKMISQDLQLFCTMTVAVPVGAKDSFFEKLTNLQVEISEIQE
jgi:uncharacterized YigZ family protein